MPYKDVALFCLKSTLSCTVQCTRTHTLAHSPMHTLHACTHMDSHTHAHTHTCTHTWTHTHTHTHVRIHTCTHSCMHTHTCTHSRMHTHTHGLTHICFSVSVQRLWGRLWSSYCHWMDRCGQCKCMWSTLSPIHMHIPIIWSRLWTWTYTYTFVTLLSFTEHNYVAYQVLNKSVVIPYQQ